MSTGAGRPTKRTPATIARLLESLAAGMTRRASCALAGISDQTMLDWLKDAHHPDHLEFLDAVKNAEHLAEAERIARIRAAGVGGAVVKRQTVTKRGRDGSEIVDVHEEFMPPAWQADAWYLERKFRDTWARPTERTTFNIDNRTQIQATADSIIIALLKADAGELASPDPRQVQAGDPETAAAGEPWSA